MKKIIILSIIILCSKIGFAQKREKLPLDTIIFACGANGDRVKAMQTNYENYASSGAGNILPQSTFPTNLIQYCGNFRIFYIDLVNAPAVGFADPTVVGASTLGQLRQNTFCAVLTYMQTVITIPTGAYIDIYVDASLNGTSNPAPSTTQFLAHAGPYYPVGGLGTQGFYSGNVFSNISTGVDPDPNNYDAYLQVNFDKIWNGAGNFFNFINYWDDYQNTTASCQIDLYSVLLHEMTHTLGFISFVKEDGTTNHNPICTNGAANAFSVYDQLFLYYSTTNVPTGTFTKVVNTSPAAINPTMATFSMPLRSSSIWTSNTGSPTNQPVYSGDKGSLPYQAPNSSDPTNSSYMSHLNDNYSSFTYNAQYSPGYQPNYLMSPGITTEMFKREWTLPELRILSQLGYTFNYPFNSSYSTSGTVNAALISNTSAHRNNYNKVSEFTNYGTIGTTISMGFQESPQTNADFSITTNSNTAASPTTTQLVINLSSDATLVDNEGDPISIFPSSLFNIRGCGSGGNNHNCLVLSNGNKTITYTPRPGFSGRAQFGFYLTDGKERGALKVYTIDIANIDPTYLATLTTMGSNLIMNPTFEEGTETRLRVTSESIENTGLEFYREGQFCTGDNLSDDHPYLHYNNPWDLASGLLIQNSWKACGQVNAGRLGNYGGWWDDFNTNGYSINSMPQYLYPVANTATIPNDRYARISSLLYSQLLNSAQSCHRYRFEADVNFQQSGLTVGSVYTFTVNFTNPPSQPTIASGGWPVVTVNDVVPIAVTVTTTALNTWQHISYDFNYCGNSSTYMNIFGPLAFIDNLSLIEVTPIPLTATINSSNSQVCTGGCTQLSSVIANQFCPPTYTWTPGSTHSSSLTACPTSTTVYTLSANDGCSTATTVTTVTFNPLPAPTVTITAAPSFSLCVNTTTTLTASGASTYSWSTGATTASVSITPTITTTYSVVATGTNSCQNTASSTLTVNPPPHVVINGNLSVCTGQNTTLTASGANTYSWSTGATTAAISVSPSVTTTYSVIGTNTVTGCSATATVSVANWGSAPTITVTASPTSICVNQSATLTASGGTYYGWSTGATTASVTASPTVTTIYTVTVYNSANCISTQTVALTVTACTVCPSCVTTLTGTITSTTSVPDGGSYCINSNITISGSVNLSRCEFKMAPNVVITVAPSSSLTISNCHLYSCNSMWQGIVVASNSFIEIAKNSLIEDAYVAVTSTTTTNHQMATFYFEQVIFNRNQISAQMVSTNIIAPPTGTVYPINMYQTVFTSRTINTSGATLPNWPTYAVLTTTTTPFNSLASPYLNSYISAPTKNVGYPLAGIRLKNIGLNIAGGTINEVQLGNNDDPMPIIYDNMYYGIYATNTNLTVLSSVFQNGLYQHTPLYVGTGVYAHSTDNLVSGSIEEYRVQIIPTVPTLSTTPVAYNSFYNLYNLTDINHYYITNITQNNCYSSTAAYTYTFPITGHTPGESGFNVVTNRYNPMNISNNNIYNIANSILFTADIGLYGSSVSGRYGGQVNINNNYIRPNKPSIAVGNQSVVSGISANDVMTSPGSYTNITVAGTNISIQNNIVDKVYNGIYAANFGLQPVNTYSNYITTVLYPGYSVPTNQYGINISAVATGTVNDNYISTNITTTNKSRNITISSTGTLGIACNTETGGWRGMEFNGTNVIHSLAINTFSNNAEGLALDNSGVIGQQGASTSPEENQWLGTWGTSNTSPPYKTATYGTGSSAQHSPIWVRNLPTHNPDGNGFAGGTGVIGTDNFSHTSTPTITLPYYTAFHAIYTCSATPTPTCTNCRVTQPAMTPQDSAAAINIKALKEKVVLNAIRYEVQDSAVQRFLSRMNIYRALRADTNNFQGSNILRRFYNHMQQSNIEKLYKAEDAMLLGDYNSAQGNLSSVSNVNNIENNYLNYYRVLINNKKGIMNASDSSDLLSLAQSCPFTNGNVVYQARALYNIINSPYTIFKDNCGSGNMNNRMAGISSEGYATPIVVFDAYVYPNPNAGKDVAINTLNLANGTVAIKFTDVEGRIVFENNYTVENGTTTFKLTDIKNGIYFVHITNLSTGEKVVKKLVIQY